MFWDQMSDLQRLQRRMNRLFEEVPAAGSEEFPMINLWSGEEGYRLHAEVPGLDPASIDITVVGNTVTLRGSRQESKIGEQEVYHRRERGFGQFVRSIQLPHLVEADKVEARYEHGVLDVTLPRSEASKPRKISLKST